MWIFTRFCKNEDIKKPNSNDLNKRGGSQIGLNYKKKSNFLSQQYCDMNFKSMILPHPPSVSCMLSIAMSLLLLDPRVAVNCI